MKKLYFLLVLILILSTVACNNSVDNQSSSQNTNSTASNSQIEIADVAYGTFSYKDDSAKYKIGDTGVINWDLKNTTEQEVADGYAAVTLAHNELKVIYDQISADYDEDAKVWRVDFYLKGSENHDNQIVYIDENGKTIMYIWGK